jgi:hypothetical protein
LIFTNTKRQRTRVLQTKRREKNEREEKKRTRVNNKNEEKSVLLLSILSRNIIQVRQNEAREKAERTIEITLLFRSRREAKSTMVIV